ncbi:MAG: TetR/AcrR family transcriptional regulator [Acidobacteriota bacterium]
MRDAKRTATVILQAAERVILQSGIEKTTIDEVAREAGVSKGGVLHHFPGKEAIVVGLLASLIQKFEADVKAKQALDPDPGAFTRAYLKAATEWNDHCIEVSFSLKAGFRNCPELQKLLADAHSRWQTCIENDGIDPVAASMVRLATDGLWLARVHHAVIPSEPFRSALIKRLVALTRTSNVPTPAKSARSKKSAKSR